MREPLSQDILFTKQFAKATGDLGFLSQNDIELIALTLALHREAGGSVRERPSILQTGEGSVGFDWAPAAASKESRNLKASAAPADGTWSGQAEPEAAAKAERNEAAVTHFAEAGEKSVAEILAAVEEAESQAAVEGEAENEHGDSENAAEKIIEEAATADDAKEERAGEAQLPTSNKQTPAAAGEDNEEVEGEAEASDSDEDGSSAGEWVTQDNMHRFGLGVQPAAEVKATCATADYSVQNVLLQMGITPLTFDGFAVRSVKLWGLVCRACFHFSRDTQKVFCPKCGHDTVVRVPIIVDKDGQPKVLNNGRPLRKKGTVYSIPKTQGGRGWKPIYAEDEVLMGGRDREMRRAEKLQNKERQARDPFNEDNACRAWYQRSGCKGGAGADIPRMKAGLGRANPNANNYKHKNSNRKKR